MTGHEHMPAEAKEALAREHFGKSFDELDTSQKRAVGGFYTGQSRGHHEGGEQAHQEGAGGKKQETQSAGGDPAEHHESGHMSSEDKERVAQKHFGASYDSLDTNQKKAVGGFYRAEALGHEGYSEMGKTRHNA